jgi:hypothetical protein
MEVGQGPNWGCSANGIKNNLCNTRSRFCLLIPKTKGRCEPYQKKLYCNENKNWKGNVSEQELKHAVQAIRGRRTVLRASDVLLNTAESSYVK